MTLHVQKYTIMELKDLFYGIEDFMVNIAFAPLDWLRSLQLESWLAANSINWIFILIMICALSFWTYKLGIFNEDEEDHYASSHRYSDKGIDFFLYGNEKNNKH